MEVTSRLGEYGSSFSGASGAAAKVGGGAMPLGAPDVLVACAQAPGATAHGPMTPIRRAATARAISASPPRLRIEVLRKLVAQQYAPTRVGSRGARSGAGGLRQVAAG